MKKCFNVYTILIVFLLLIQQIISGCATTVTKDVQNEEVIKEVPRKEVVVKEDLAKEVRHKEDAGLVGRKLYQAKCSFCHEMQDIAAYTFTPKQWVSVIDNMHDGGEYREFIKLEEEEKIKGYLKNISQKK